MIRTTLVLLALGVLPARPASGMLLPMTLEDFFDNTSCVGVVEVIAVEDTEEAELLSAGLSPSRAARLNRLARMRVDRWIVANSCGAPEHQATFLFSTEVHSSSPKVGHRYLVFPQSTGPFWTEAIYGRSVWEINTSNEVLVTHQNEFLLSPLDLRSGEIARVPLETVERLLTRALGSSEP